MRPRGWWAVRSEEENVILLRFTEKAFHKPPMAPWIGGRGFPDHYTFPNTVGSLCREMLGCPNEFQGVRGYPGILFSKGKQKINNACRNYAGNGKARTCA